MHESSSPAWLSELRERLADTTGPDITIQYVIVPDAPTDGQEVTFHLRLGPDGTDVVEGPSEHPDAVFTVDAATASAIRNGELDTAEAFINGQLELSGDATRLIEAYRDRA